MNITLRTLALGLPVVVAATATADIINVPADQPTIQRAIDAAGPGDEIVVAPGSYLESFDFSGKAITVRSVDPSDPDVVGMTSITSRSGRVVRCVSGEGPDTVLAGLTISGPVGGGMVNEGSSPTVIDCVFHGCAVEGNGGGMRNASGSSPTVTRCIFDTNTASGNGSRGGGISNTDSNATVTDCLFVDNLAEFYGGGMDSVSGVPMVIGCEFRTNRADVNGGGLDNDTCSSVVVNCLFIENSAGGDGGGIHNAWPASPSISGCVFTANTAGYAGGGVSCVNDNLATIANCTFTGNTAPMGGGITSYNDSHPLIDACILEGNEAGLFGGGVQTTDNATLADTIVCGNMPDQLAGPWTDAGGNAITEGCGADCNVNRIPDEEDIADGTSLDCNGNGIPDECDVAYGNNDCNGNAIPDDCDLAEGISEDCDDNGLPDECDTDCNGNGTPDACDLAEGFSEDCDGNGVPDECDLDCDDNGTPDSCDIAEGAEDQNGDGVLDVCQPVQNLTAGTFHVTIWEGINAAQDGDEIMLLERTYEESVDLNGKAIILRSTDPEDPAVVAATVIDGYDSAISCTSGEGRDTVIDGLTILTGPVGEAAAVICFSSPTFRNCAFVGSHADYGGMYCFAGSPLVVSCRFTENTGTFVGGIFSEAGPRKLVPTLVGTIVCGNTPGQIVGPWTDAGGNIVSETCAPCVFEMPVDCNDNRVPDCEDILAGRSADCNGNGIPDECDVEAGTSADCDRNGIPDECDSDCNGNGVPDACDVAEGTSPDRDGDGVPDECQPVRNLTSGEFFETIQGAIDAAANGDDIALLQGTYAGSIDLGGKAITLRSEDPTDPAVVAGTILTSSSGRVVLCVNGEGPDTVLAGLTITGPSGGGMRNEASSPTVTDCVFSGSAVNGSGGGMRNIAGSEPTVTRCTFASNDALGVEARGGGMSNHESHPTVTDCLFIDNAADKYGGGLDNQLSDPIVTACEFRNNHAGIDGGGLDNDAGSPAVLDCLFIANTADDRGGGVACVNGSQAILVGCTLVGNQASAEGGALWSDADPSVANSLICGNSAPQMSGMWSDGGGNEITGGCEGDCNANGVTDREDIAEGTSLDCNVNGIPDECELTSGVETDCNDNGILDTCDIAEGASDDCNLDGIPDECEGADPLTGSALRFNDPDAAVVMADYQGFPLLKLTVSFWMRSTGADDGILSYAVTNGSDNEFLVFDQSSLTIWIRGEFHDTGIDVADGVWHHIGVTWHFESGATVLYVDGATATTQTLAQFSPILGGGTLYLGQEQDCVGGCLDPEQAYQGDLDEVRVWNVVRTVEEINADRYTTLTGDEPGLVGYWRLDDGAGALAEDHAGDNDGVVIDALWIATYRDGGDCCPADVDSSGDVAFADLLAVLSAWGPCDGCPEDTDGDANVGFADLLLVLSAWGPCP